MTIDDFRNLLALITSNQLTVYGNQVQQIAQLQAKLAALIQAPPTAPPTKEPQNADSPGLTE